MTDNLQAAAGGATIRASAVLTLADLAGVGTPLGPDDLRAAAKTLGLAVAKVGAVVEVESRGRGFGSPDAQGLARPVILFEPHIFHRETKGRFSDAWPDISYPTWGTHPYPGSQKTRYAQLEQAMRLDLEAALKSASWGLFQIMGYNAGLCGFADVSAFVRAMARDEAAQLAAFAAFLLRQPPMLGALKLGDWAGFARRYNGEGYAQHGYDQRLKVAFRRRVSAGGDQ